MVIDFTNEKGNVSVTVRKGIREQAKEKLEEVLSHSFDEVSENEVGGFSIPIAEDRATGDIIYIHVDFSVSNKEKTKSKKTEKRNTTPTKSTPIPVIFPKGKIAEAITIRELMEGDGE